MRKANGIISGSLGLLSRNREMKLRTLFHVSHMTAMETGFYSVVIIVIDMLLYFLVIIYFILSVQL